MIPDWLDFRIKERMAQDRVSYGAAAAAIRREGAARKRAQAAKPTPFSASERIFSDQEARALQRSAARCAPRLLNVLPDPRAVRSFRSE